MKTFVKYFALPLLIAVIASALCITDAIIGGLFVEGAGFMWVAFVIWTIFYGAKFEDRIRGLIGIVVGFFVAVLMMLVTGSFTLNIWTISLSSLLGVFVFNFAVMFMNHGTKVWLNSVTGAFAGIGLTFSGLGIGMSPMGGFADGALMLAILVVYSILGMACGYFSITYQTKILDKAKSYETVEEVKVEEPKKETKKEKKTEK